MRVAKNKFIILIALLVLLVSADFFSKNLANNYNLITLNEGISFGLMSGQANNIFFTIFFVFIIFYLLLLIFRTQNSLQQQISLLLITSGSIGNFIDRLLFAGVRDWLSLPFSNLKNNFADYYIFAGSAILIISLINELYNGGDHEKLRDNSRK